MTGLLDSSFPETKNPPAKEGFLFTKLLRGCEINQQALFGVWIKRPCN